MTTRTTTQRCTVCSVELDHHTETDFVECDSYATLRLKAEMRILPTYKMDPGWSYTLPGRYQA